MRTSAAARLACSPSWRSLRGRRLRERRAGRRGVEIASFDARLDGAHDDALELPRTARLDQLPAERSEQRVCDRWQPQLAHALEARVASPMSGSRAKRRRNSVWSASTARTNRNRSRPSSLAARSTTLPSSVWLADATSTRSPTRSVVVKVAVAELPRRVARVPRAERERVRAGGANDPLEGQLLRAAVSAFTPRSYARRRIGSASSSRPCSRRSEAHSTDASPAAWRRP